MWRAFRLWIKGEKVIVPEEVQIEREMECHAPCPHWDEESDQCRVCTCFVALKILWASEKCPKGRWKKWRKYLYKPDVKDTTL